MGHVGRVAPVIRSSLKWFVLTLYGFGAAPHARAEELAIFAGGCFWCLEADYEGVPGVIDASTGYVGGDTPLPTYRSVSDGETGHYKAVRVVFDPALVDYRQLLRIFWLSIDPAEPRGQFCDRSDSNRAAIFVLNSRQRATAEASKAEVARLLRRPVVTAVLPARRFWPAEALFQDYAQRYPLRFQYYIRACERDRRLREVWSDVRVKTLDQ